MAKRTRRRNSRRVNTRGRNSRGRNSRRRVSTHRVSKNNNKNKRRKTRRNPTREKRAGMNSAGGKKLSGLVFEVLREFETQIEGMSESEIIEKIRQIRNTFNELYEENPTVDWLQPWRVDHFLENIIKGNQFGIELEERIKLKSGSWICAGCGLPTNQNPCGHRALACEREKYIVEDEDGTDVERERDLICNTERERSHLQYQ